MLDSVTDCPSLLCEELEAVETKNDPSQNNRRRKEEEVQVLQQRDDEEAAQEVAREDEQELEGMKAESKLLAAEAEEKEVRQEAEEVQVDEEFENNQETETCKEEKDRKSSDERDEKRRSRKRKGRKQSERGRNRKCVKRVSEQQEEKNSVQSQEMSAVSSEDGSALSEPPVGLMNSCDLSDPVYMGCGVPGPYCPPVSMLYSSQPPVSIQPAPPQPHGTKRPLSPLLPHTLPQPGPQPLEVGTVCSHLVSHKYIKNKDCSSC